MKVIGTFAAALTVGFVQAVPVISLTTSKTRARSTLQRELSYFLAETCSETLRRAYLSRAQGAIISSRRTTCSRRIHTRACPSCAGQPCVIRQVQARCLLQLLCWPRLRQPPYAWLKDLEPHQLPENHGLIDQAPPGLSPNHWTIPALTNQDGFTAHAPRPHGLPFPLVWLTGTSTAYSRSMKRSG